MKKKLPLKLFALAFVGLLATASIPDQESAIKANGTADLALKPCLVVTGGVKTPTRFELRRPVRLAEALFFAGGLTESVDGFIKVVRTDTECFQSKLPYPTEKDFPASATLETFEISALMRGDEKANPVLSSGYVVIVTELSPVFVVGNVKQQKEIVLRGSLTITRAIELAGGVLPKSKTNEVHVYRMQNGKVGGADITIDLEAIKKGRIPDLVLLPYDIIEVRHKKSRHRIPGDLLSGVGSQLAAGIIE